MYCTLYDQDVNGQALTEILRINSKLFFFVRVCFL